ncbi:CrcB family protein [Manganibacter manganicus]|uniref:Fluoride-specific ion channel FluC n=1 Tax=Manganibacter manganicus TaxID=1873176 RepID=A0A1V8RLU6_9HYPH|nr:CrcB family protein [Pseudaminobacter manganicus]OQM73929.1 chromosome condensation protein CrcB [Pseudaminobacter manganicus]
MSGSREILSLYAVVAIGSVIGSVLRALASLAALAWIGAAFPWGTLFVNVAGSLIIGFYAAITGPNGRIFASVYQRQFVMTGICGGFTTFSVFSLEAFRFLNAGDLALSGLYVGVSIAAWLLSVWLGHALGSRFNRLGGF